ncbi:methyl-accepting chemotaxis protein [Aerosakkonema sp. BLCC-F183]|uniref:methyl-accepting chemotaxis protein n=1 Tax=Aerosakkonema sp. BLCC-F183 TaxID=3342834 RepID=UPI0035B91180
MENLLPARIIKQWQRLLSNHNFNNQNLDKDYSELKQSISELLSRVGNTSNLILDPDLDSYYLMDVVLLALPQAQQRMEEILLYSQNLSSKKQLDLLEKVDLGVYASSLKADLGRIMQGIATSLREDKNFYGEVPSLQNIPPVLKSYELTVNDFSKKLVEVLKNDNINLINNSFFTEGEEVVSKGSQLWTVTREEMDNMLERRLQYLQIKQLIYLLSSLITLAISSFFVVKISREISFRLSQAGLVTKNVAQGDFTTNVKVDYKDEIGELFATIKYMVKNLNYLLKSTQESGIQVSASANQLLITAKQQEEVVENQAVLMLGGMRSAQEISKLIEKMADRINLVACKSEETTKFASQSQLDIIKMKEAMQEMGNASINISKKLEIIKEKAENVSLVLNTMTKVADQTNLLSLNAAVEAEKAGKLGAGFAVVAREIRRLADQTSVGTLDIERIIGEMQLSVSEGVVEMNNFITEFFEGVDKVSTISNQLAKIIEQVQALSPQIEGVNVVMKNQSENVQKISILMVNINQGMQEIKKSLNQTYTAIEKLTTAAITLRDQVSRFKVFA